VAGHGRDVLRSIQGGVDELVVTRIIRLEAKSPIEVDRGAISRGRAVVTRTVAGIILERIVNRERTVVGPGVERGRAGSLSSERLTRSTAVASMGVLLVIVLRAGASVGAVVGIMVGIGNELGTRNEIGIGVIGHVAVSTFDTIAIVQNTPTLRVGADVDRKGLRARLTVLLSGSRLLVGVARLTVVYSLRLASISKPDIIVAQGILDER
jgi:hypothetical protein